MKILEAGHSYRLDVLDCPPEEYRGIILDFVKREGPNFPFNEGAHSGTTCQEVLRALIDRTDYLNRQKPCAETEAAGGNLRSALLLYELRAARLHGRFLGFESTQHFVSSPLCSACLHIGCEGRCRE